VVICVSERSLVSVLIAARVLSSLVPRFRVAVGELLLRPGVSNEEVRAERELRLGMAGRTERHQVAGEVRTASYVVKTLSCGSHGERGRRRQRSLRRRTR
jgi:hypothetical protein